MSQGHYSVIRCIPDPARGETFNVGAAIWCRGAYAISVDQVAARRAAKENPHFAIDALSSLESSIRAQLQELDPINTTKFQRMRRNHRGIPFVYSDPRFINIPNVGIDPLVTALEKVMDRMVRAAQIALEDESPENPVQVLADRIMPLISAGRVIPGHRLDGKKTGHSRHVDFFVTLGAKVAIDVLRLDVRDEETAMRRADLEAFKIYDVTDASQVSEFYVVPFRNQDGEQQSMLEDPRRAITSVHGKILRDINEAEEVIRRKAG